jgi:hypothetical protein
VASTLSQAVRRFDLRQSHSIGLARTHLQQVLTATAMNVVRVIAWLRDTLLGDKKRPGGRFARLAPAPLASEALAAAGVTSPTESQVHRRLFNGVEDVDVRSSPG